MSKSTKGGMSPLAGRADVDLERQKLPHRPAVSVCSSTQSIAPIYIRRQSKTPPPSSTWDKIKILVLVGLVPLTALMLVIAATYWIAGGSTDQHRDCPVRPLSAAALAPTESDDIRLPGST